jgi:hypothetical protein
MTSARKTGGNVCKLISTLLGSILCLTQIGNTAPRAPLPPLPEFAPVSFSERFDGYYTNGMTAPEIVVSGYGTLVESWSGYALARVGNVVPLVIDGVQNGHTNVFPGGAVRLWVKPDWASAGVGTGQGPGQVAKIAELSVVANGQAAVAWSLQVSAEGSAISLVGAGVNESGVLLTAELAWQMGEWHQVVLNYTEKGTALVLDGELAAEGAGVLAVPSSAAVLAIGSSLAGTQSFAGELEDVYCFARPLNGAFHYLPYKDTAAAGPITIAQLATRAELAAQRQAAKALRAQGGEESGGGLMLRMAGPAVDCVTNGPVYLTNVVCLVTTNEGWTVCFDIMGGETNAGPYDIFSTPELRGNDITNSVWTWLETGNACETHAFTNQATNQTFYILTLPGADRDGDGLYDGWEWKHFGTLAQTAEGDYDGDGVSNDDAYTNESDPNQLKFTLGFGNSYVNGNSATGSVTVLQGVPEAVAVLVNSTNFETAVWQPYQTNIVASLGTTDGAYVVWVGLRGHAWDTKRIWHGTTITRDTVAPLVAIANPTTNLTASPVLQLQGYANEPLLAVRYDLTNATGLQTNLAGYVTQQYLDPNTFSFTTNWFQCYDVGLETNLNSITLRIADLAGNVTTTNINLTLDYGGDTNAPVITVIWPEDNALVAGTSFTLRGQLDEAAASVTASLGAISFAGEVDRNGSFEISGIPIETATNTLSIIATDAAGNSRTNTLTVRQSAETLTINPVASSELTQPTISVTGTVGVSDQSVWVNGVAATVDDNNWTAIIPTPQGGVANIDVQTGSSPSTPTAAQNLSVESPPQVRPMGYLEELTYDFRISNGNPMRYTRSQKWARGVGGTSRQTSQDFSQGFCEATIVWPATWPDHQSFSGDCSCLLPPMTEYGETTIIPWQKSGVNYAEDLTGPDEGLTGNYTRTDTVQRKVETLLELVVGGVAKAAEPRLLRLTVAAATYANPADDFVYSGAASEVDQFETPGDVPLLAASSQLYGQALTPTATNAYVGEHFTTQPADSTNSLPLTITGANRASFVVNAEDMKLKMFMGTNTTDIAGKTNEVVVGQKISLRCELSYTNAVLTNFQWTIPGFAISNYVADANSSIVYSNFPTVNSNIAFFWVDGGNRQVECSAMLNGNAVRAKTTFKVIRPMPEFYAAVRDTVRVGTNHYVFGTNTGNTFLHFGINTPGINNTDVGIAFVYTNAPILPGPNETYGRYFITQVIESFRLQYNIRSNVVCLDAAQWDGHGLDNSKLPRRL